jgi:aryl-alcohol dehydrogenase-like predicted oxidoreductase
VELQCDFVYIARRVNRWSVVRFRPVWWSANDSAKDNRLNDASFLTSLRVFLGIMEFRKLGDTSIDVSVLCLGTQTWGEQNSEADACEQMDVATESGMNFFDTAEMYPFPARKETSGKTETIIGNWLRKRKRRDEVILATKVTSRSDMGWLGKKGTRLTPARIKLAIEGSLKRLHTDYIDLYQLHWPDRYTNNFGRLCYDPDRDDSFIPLEDQLAALKELVDEGKARYIGLSNETPWGLMTFLKISESRGWPRVVSVQNPFSLLNRTFEVGLSEIAIRETCGLLAYSPLAFGLLTGKYSKMNETIEEGRITRFSEASKRYSDNRDVVAASEYVHIATKYGINPAQMALAFNLSRQFITSTIIGATKLEQLQNNIRAVDVKLSRTVLDEIETIHNRNLFPCP